MKTLRQIMTLLVMACIVFASSTAFAASLQDEVLNEVNLERTAAGIQPLSGIVYLDQAAGTRAQEAGILFAHQRPDGSPVKSVLNGASCSWFGENLAIENANHQIGDSQEAARLFDDNRCPLMRCLHAEEFHPNGDVGDRRARDIT